MLFVPLNLVLSILPSIFWFHFYLCQKKQQQQSINERPTKLDSLITIQVFFLPTSPSTGTWLELKYPWQPVWRQNQEGDYEGNLLQNRGMLAILDPPLLFLGRYYFILLWIIQWRIAYLEGLQACKDKPYNHLSIVHFCCCHEGCYDNCADVEIRKTLGNFWML